MEDQAEDILRSFSLTEAQRGKYDVVKEKLEKHFVKHRNVIFERAKFNRRVQGPDETCDSFITSLYCLAEYCSYGSSHDEVIRDLIVVGIGNSQLSEKLQLDPDLTLDKAINAVRHNEAVKGQQTVIRSQEHDERIVAVAKDKEVTWKHKTMCTRCGYMCIQGKHICSARTASCHSYG